jgi:phosphate transport system substrate-binding protein
MARSLVARIILLLITPAILSSTLIYQHALAEPLVIQGSTTFARRLMDPHKDAIEAEAKHELTVIPNKSLPGLIALMEGRAHMAMISAPLHSEIEALKKIMPGLAYNRLQTHEILNTRISFALHPSNRVRRASLNQVRKILLGEIDNWRDLGGPDLPIRVVLVGGGGGVTTTVEVELLGGRRVSGTHVIYVKTPVQLVQVIAQEPAAIGFAQLALSRQKGLAELVTEHPIEQTLSIITFGDPTAAMNDVIQAARRVAERVM